MPSLTRIALGWPSVAIQRLPALSKVRLSGAAIGLTCSFGCAR
jgi:hypothetical protein